MAQQQRTVGQVEAARIIKATGSVLRKREAGRYTYWSAKLGSWVVMTKLNDMTYQVSWDGTADCGC